MSDKLCIDCKLDFKQDIINMLIQTIDKKDTYTSGHSKRVAKYSLMIAKEIKLSEDNIGILYQSALMHDLGKVLISEFILQKQDKLEADEYEIIKRHALIGWEMLKEIKLFQEHAVIIKHHHEWYDGNGYPDQLKENDISILSRIIAIADAYDAMTSARNYRQNLSTKQALYELQQCSGSQFDPTLIPIAIKIFKIHKLK